MTDNTTPDNSEIQVPEVPEIQEVNVSRANLVIISEAENKKARWYVVHVYSGHENKVAETLKQRAETLQLTDKVLQVLIPTQEKIQIKRGQRKTVQEKIFPGYMLVKLELSDDAWLAVRTTQGVTGFVGVGAKPKPLPSHEVDAIMQYTNQAAPSYKADYVEGEAVVIVDGPFNEFLGMVNSIDEERGKVEVLVNIFGRETPVQLDFLQVKKA
ncbi:MAG: transcription termination/antitermination protein NusG [Candidatus Pacebacteria bacterium CG10_big_fil_rev_8_21_14_0_10_42_12]|nr:transcription termination/antitermination factor NusG [Candidatus Paceibacterota bacterium]PIR62550.1 MAG: transcription termination/antitermination protein NusG [Candidatus Pacebacteria bacterium CG10_big_fil_rev_8_21_14_0_10_42_12]